jgi:hypothetical protein
MVIRLSRKPSDHRPSRKSLGPRCAIAARPSAIFSKKLKGFAASKFLSYQATTTDI